MSNMSFCYFPLLPPEIRLMIWEYCIPNRVAEYDAPWFLLDGFRTRQACYSESTMRQNSRPPAIAAVNSESRKVVLRNGKFQECKVMEFDRLRSAWIQPHRDIRHLNWVRDCWVNWADGIDETSDIGDFFFESFDLGMTDISITAESILPFRLDMLVLDYYTYLTPADWDLDAPGGPYKQDTEQIGHLAHFPQVPRIINVVMVAISLHISKDAAVRSGLFGLLGDAPVQMIDVDTQTRLREFEKLFYSHTLERERDYKVVKLFDLFKTSQFQDEVKKWTKEAEQLTLVELWHSARENGLVSVDEPDENHPFMREARRLNFRLRPQIMIRACDNQCYMEGHILSDSKNV
ncbi:hypothetical protein PENSTE_c025G04030 [Penicillium steckii]|uniref:2EXR domain-containing protein n=1 Tax=Penicillium steckii TaxID=303698 RepID=A0A1V6SQ35_9EURO|nr:hypothetical protein PENSTE_c025G04030 [Penicillium steckii]